MDPLPPINKVFSLVSQEEKYRTIGSQLAFNGDTTNTTAFVVHNDSNRHSNGVPTYHFPVVLIMVAADQVLMLGVPTGQALILVFPTSQAVDRSVLTTTTLDTLLKSATSCMVILLVTNMVILLVTNINPSLHLAILLTPWLIRFQVVMRFLATLMHPLALSFKTWIMLSVNSY